MIGSDELGQAFISLAPHISDPEGALREADIDPNALAPIAQNLVHMYAAAGTPPEDAVPASFTIGFMVGMAIQRMRDTPDADS